MTFRSVDQHLQEGYGVLADKPITDRLIPHQCNPNAVVIVPVF